MFVVAVSAVKDLFEDIKRHRADAQENLERYEGRHDSISEEQ
jgi:hypothetical protein